MAANVESMFYVRTTPWHGLGTRVEEALTSKDALHYSGLDWKVEQEALMTETFHDVEGFKANVRSDNRAVLGVVSNRYQVVQNEEAFAFTDALVGEGVTYETAGSLNGGRRVWLLAKLPEKYQLVGDTVEPYVVFTNSHDGSAAIRMACTPVRVVCQNTLNLALNTVRRSWAMNHTSRVQTKLDEARDALFRANQYLDALQEEAERLSMQRLTDKKVLQWIDELLPLADDATEMQKTNVTKLRSDLTHRYFDAPDLVVLPKTGWRFINAVSDFATHAQPIRATKDYQKNLFVKTIDGHPVIDKAMQLLAV